ncbi:MAG: CCA tRNA nucleotidyltransferase [Nitrososphaeria archaeon]
MLDELLKEARRLTTPNKLEVEKAGRVAETVIESIKQNSLSSPFKPEVISGGSFARDTWLPSEADIDIFLRYPLNASKTDLEQDSFETASKVFGRGNLIIRYAEHPYVETYVDGIRVNVVPCYNVAKGRWLTAADRSPYHLEFMKKNLTQEQKSDVRILKKFMKVAGIYGAEIKVGGFSGYMCEVLIFRFKSFKDLVTSASEWRLPIVITDLEQVENAKEQFINDKLIITDPVDVNRNLGKALSIKTFSRFIIACRSLLKTPKIEYFIGKRVETRALTSPLLENLLAIYFEHKEMSVDILWGMLNHTVKSLAKHFENYGFKIVRSLAVSNDKDASAFIFLFEENNIPKYEIRHGPYAFEKENTNKFTSKNKDISVLMWINEDGRICALKNRNITTNTSFAREILKDPTKYGVSKKIVEPLKNNGKILLGREVKADSRRWITEGVKEILEPTDQNYLS